MWTIIFIFACIIILFFAYALCAAAGMADQKMEKILNQKGMVTEPDFPNYLPDPRDESEFYEKIICPNCHHENFIIKGACSYCEKCHHKIGSCDD